ncbi:hypothetical protein BS78_K039800 [Paspalum vaginatum]|uniref:non-specific serine/threonine protein kinase n=1 Tax=Paspalum vaginatum TaxID=158149 RepID=A0A9W8CDU2_9POAL|nr:hypothetical protein BS78_K039800 [Paspalum vaginatum]
MSPSRCRLQLTVYGALLVVLGLVAAPGALSQDPRPCATKANGSYVCPDCSPSAANSSRGAAFEANVLRFRDALKVMSAGGNATFLNATFAAAGDAAGDMVYGLAACLADAERIACAACLAAASELPGTRCGGARAMVLWFFGVADTSPARRYLVHSPNGFSNPGAQAMARAVLGGRMLSAAKTPVRSVRGVEQLVFTADNGEQSQGTSGSSTTKAATLQGVAQCTQDLPPEECGRCLRSHMDWLGVRFADLDGVRLNGASCYLRYDLKAVDPRPSTAQPTTDPLVPSSAAIRSSSLMHADIVAGVPGAQQLPQRYSYADVREMTSSFTERLGQGGFGTVYKGRLPDGRDVAVKMLNETKDDFLNEVSSISSTSHVNVVKLLGFCLDVSKTTGKACLIYEYMPKGSLDRYAVGRGGERLSWDRMFNIVVGVARGLEYLHRGCNDHILHLDIKPHNILLDQNLRPKISDFGLAKIRPQESNIAVSVTIGKGTISYMAPELIWPHLAERPGVATSKADVYSYGMTVLEVVGARRSVDNGEGASGSSDDDPGNYFQLLYDDLDGFCRTAACGCDDQAGAEDLLKKMTVVGLWCIRARLWRCWRIPRSTSWSGRHVKLVRIQSSIDVPILNFLFLLSSSHSEYYSHCLTRDI